MVQGSPAILEPSQPLRVLSVLGISLAVLACGTTEKNQATSSPRATATTAQAQPATPKPQSLYHVGDHVEIYSDDRTTDVVVTVNKVDTAKSGNPYITPPPNGLFLTVDATIENRSAQPFNASLLNFEVRDDTGQSYSQTSLPDLPQSASGEVAPNDKVRGTSAFGVPSGHSYKLYFKAIVLGSQGQTVFDLGTH